MKRLTFYMAMALMLSSGSIKIGDGAAINEDSISKSTSTPNASLLTNSTSGESKNNASVSESLSPVASSAAEDNLESTAARIPRGTVYQIRPVNFPPGDKNNPFENIDAVTDFKFPNLKSISLSSQSASSSSLRYNNAQGIEDSEAEEAVHLPKYIQTLVAARSSDFEERSSEEKEESSEEREQDKEQDREQIKIRTTGIPLASSVDSNKLVGSSDNPVGSSSAGNKKKKSSSDKSYAFGYTLEDSSRHEVADPNGNVNGYYTYVDDEGFIRKVVYTAGPGKGFVILKKERKPGPPIGVMKVVKKVKPKNKIESSEAIPNPTTANPNLRADLRADLSADLRKEALKKDKPLTERPKSRRTIVEVEEDSPEDGAESEYLPYQEKSQRNKPIFVVRIKKPSRHESSQIRGYPKRPQNRHLHRQKYQLVRLPGLDMPILLPVEYIPSSATVVRSTTTPLLKRSSSVSSPSPSPSPRSHTHRKPKLQRPSSSHHHIHRADAPIVFVSDSGRGGRIDDNENENDDDDDDGSYREGREFTLAGNDEDSDEDDGQWDGYLGDGSDGPFPPPTAKKTGGTFRVANPDASYSFGYETDTANRLEKADNFGNVRGSYSYIDENGVKRTVHYVAGSSTGYQVIASSPSSARSMRIEAPPGFAISRRSQKTAESTGGPLAYSNGNHPSAIIYHIHPDSTWRPWEGRNGLVGGGDGGAGKPRKMRKVMRIMRKKPRTDVNTKPVLEEEEDKIKDKPTILALQNHPPSELVVRERDGPRPFRHSTRVQKQIQMRQRMLEMEEQQIQDQKQDQQYQQALVDASNAFYERRRVAGRKHTGSGGYPSHRAYTDLRESKETDESYLRNDPILFSPNYEALNEARESRIIPNPILLKPAKVSVRNRGSGSRSTSGFSSTPGPDMDSNAKFETSESKLYPVRSTGILIPITKADEKENGKMDEDAAFEMPAESIHSLSSISIGDLTRVTMSSSTSKSTVSTTQYPQEANNKEDLEGTSTSTTPIITTSTEYSIATPPTSAPPTGKPSSRRRGARKEFETKTASPTIVRMTRVEISKQSEAEDKLKKEGMELSESRNIMSSSIRLMKKLKPSSSTN